MGLHAEAFVVLNRHSDEPVPHSISMVLAQSVAVCLLLSVSLFWIRRRLPPLWACFAGAFQMLSFALVITSAVFGYAVALAAFLAGSLGAALFIDFVRKPDLGITRPFGVLLIAASTLLL